MEHAKGVAPDAFRFSAGSQVEYVPWVPQLIRGTAWEPIAPLTAGDPVPVSVSDSGAVSWDVSFGDATLLGIRRTVDLGLLDARADVIGYWVSELGGSGAPYELLQLWELCHDWLPKLLVGAALKEFVSFLKKHCARWRDEHGATPEKWFGFIFGKRAWDPDAMGRLLEINEEEAARCLQTLGYRPPGAQGSDEWHAGQETDELAARLMAYSNLVWHEAFTVEEANRIARECDVPELRHDLDRRDSHGR